jgi:hypothetical protein
VGISPLFKGTPRAVPDTCWCGLLLLRRDHQEVDRTMILRIDGAEPKHFHRLEEGSVWAFSLARLGEPLVRSEPPPGSIRENMEQRSADPKDDGDGKKLTC